MLKKATATSRVTTKSPHGLDFINKASSDLDVQMSMRDVMWKYMGGCTEVLQKGAETSKSGNEGNYCTTIREELSRSEEIFSRLLQLWEA